MGIKTIFLAVAAALLVARISAHHRTDFSSGEGAKITLTLDNGGLCVQNMSDHLIEAHYRVRTTDADGQALTLERSMMVDAHDSSTDSASGTVVGAELEFAEVLQ